MIGKRTGIDFSKHEVKTTINEFVRIYHLAIPGTSTHNIKYTNVSGALLVTGDFGNWIFCRGFEPTAGGSVSEQYWLEKLRMSSSQEPCEYRQDYTIEAINERVSELEDYGYSADELSKMKEYYECCIEHSDDELSYLSAARNVPSFSDYECIVISKDIKYWLKAVFDGFDEMCRRSADPNSYPAAERSVVPKAK